MKAEDRQSFAQALTAVAEVFREELSQLRLEAYFVALEDQPIETVQSAMAKAIKTLRFFPKPAELLDMIEGSLEDRAVAAWEDALNCCYHLEPHLDELDTVTREAVRIMGGIEEIDALTYNGATSVMRAVARKHFLEAYHVAVKRTEPRWALPPVQSHMFPKPE